MQPSWESIQPSMKQRPWMVRLSGNAFATSPFLSCLPWLRFWPFLQSEISSAQTSVFSTKSRIMLERSIAWQTLLMFMSTTVWPSQGYRDDSSSRSLPIGSRFWFLFWSQISLLAALIRIPLSSRKEDRMKKSTIQKKKLIMSGSILSVRRATSSLPCCWPWSAWPVCFLHLRCHDLFDRRTKFWQSMDSNSGQQNLDLMVTSSWYSSKTKSCKPSSLPCLWPLWEQHVMSLS